MISIHLKYSVLLIVILALGVSVGGVIDGWACDWELPHTLHWSQLPDMSPVGMAISTEFAALADDFQCNSSGPITGIQIWGAFADGMVPQNGPGRLSFTLSIYEDGYSRYSRPMGNIFCSGRASDGSTFGPDVMVDVPFTDTSPQSNPAVAVDRHGNIHVVWEDYRDDRELGNIYYSQSLDAGKSFGQDVMVDDSLTLTSEQKHPDIAVGNDGTIHVIWEDYRDNPAMGNIYYAKSMDGGRHFGPDVMADQRVTDTSEQRSPAIAVDDLGIIHVVWEDYRDNPKLGNIYYSKSTNRGESFGADVMVDDPPTITSDQVNPALTVDTQGIIHVVWEDYRDNPAMGNIYYAKSSDGGDHFGPDVMVDAIFTHTTVQRYPDIAVGSDGTIHVVWEDYRDNPILGSIYYANSSDGGRSFSKDIMIGDAITPTSHQILPTIAVDDNGIVYVAWEDYRDHPDHGSVYYCMSTDNGETFLTDTMVADAETVANPQVHPAIAVDRRGSVHVVWEDYRTSVAANGMVLGSPGELLWTHTFGPSEYTLHKLPISTEGLYEPRTDAYSPDDSHDAYQYTLCLKHNSFVQEPGKVYWLALEAVGPQDTHFRFGLKTALPTLRWRQDAVYLDLETGWLPLAYPTGHTYEKKSLDLAFVNVEQTEQPTLRPVNPTYCPPLDTQCPTEVTRCPFEISLCAPGTPTICPAMHTQCPQETVCPSDPTRCHMVHTLCPGGLSDPTRCPPVETSCPPEDTRCPIQVSRCIVCIRNAVEEPARQASTTPYVQESYRRPASPSVKQPRTLYERPCPIVETECQTLH
ncbi:hypothetical protein ACFL6U_06945 [Planctomycetota bacterium]